MSTTSIDDAEPREAARRLPQARHALFGQRPLRIVGPRVAALFGDAVSNQIQLVGSGHRLANAPRRARVPATGAARVAVERSRSPSSAARSACTARAAAGSRPRATRRARRASRQTARLGGVSDACTWRTRSISTCRSCRRPSTSCPRFSARRSGVVAWRPRLRPRARRRSAASSARCARRAAARADTPRRRRAIAARKPRGAPRDTRIDRPAPARARCGRMAERVLAASSASRSSSATRGRAFGRARRMLGDRQLLEQIASARRRAPSRRRRRRGSARPVRTRRETCSSSISRSRTSSSRTVPRRVGDFAQPPAELARGCRGRAGAPAAARAAGATRRARGAARAHRPAPTPRATRVKRSSRF